VSPCRPSMSNVDPSEGRGCCCAPSRSQQRRSLSSPLRRHLPSPMRGGSQSRGDTWCPQSCPEPGGGYHSTPLPCPSMGGQGVAPSRSDRHCLYLAATLLGLPPPLHDFNDHDHLNIDYLDIKGLSSACGTRRFSTPVTEFAPL
jgi:hypothetical protein